MVNVNKSPSLPLHFCNIAKCRKGFKRLFDLKRHQKSHNVSQKAKSPSNSPHELGSPRKGSTPANLAADQQELKYACRDDPNCTFRSFYSSTLTRHRKKEHGYVPKPRAPRRSAIPSSSSPSSKACNTSSKLSLRVQSMEKELHTTEQEYTDDTPYMLGPGYEPYLNGSVTVLPAPAFGFSTEQMYSYMAPHTLGLVTDASAEPMMDFMANDGSGFAMPIGPIPDEEGLCPEWRFLMGSN